MLHFIVGLITLAVFAIVVFDFVKSYVSATSTGWQRLLDAGRGSATILWAQFGIVVAAGLASLDQILTWVGAITGDTGATDSIKSVISQYLTPTTVGVVVMAFSIITVVARMRTMSAPPPTS